MRDELADFSELRVLLAEHHEAATRAVIEHEVRTRKECAVGHKHLFLAMHEFANFVRESTNKKYLYRASEALEEAVLRSRNNMITKLWKKTLLARVR